MREINVDKITETVKEMCININHFLSDDMKDAYKTAYDKEDSDIGKQILLQLGRILRWQGKK